MGFAPAQTNLGNIYDDVLSPPQRRKAVDMYRRAVRLGSRAGASCLAAHYRNLGKTRWYRYWLRRAAEMGDEEALNELASLAESESRSLRKAQQ
jgi:TPR repeat protein